MTSINQYDCVFSEWSNAAIAVSAGLLFGLITMLVQYVGLFMLGFHTGLSDKPWPYLIYQFYRFRVIGRSSGFMLCRALLHTALSLAHPWCSPLDGADFCSLEPLFSGLKTKNIFKGHITKYFLLEKSDYIWLCLLWRCNLDDHNRLLPRELLSAQLGLGKGQSGPNDRQEFESSGKSTKFIFVFDMKDSI